MSTDAQHAPEISGHTLLWKWTSGPTSGATPRHTFHEDGTVEWRDADQPAKSEKKGETERPRYGAIRVSDDVCLVSYLAPSGFTLTVALNFRDNTLAGFASGAEEWHQVGGTFEEVEGDG